MKKTLVTYLIYFAVCMALSGILYYVVAPELHIAGKRSIYIFPYALLIESFIVWVIALLFLLITRRAVLSIALSLFFYLIFLIGNVIKIRYLGIPIYLIDFTQVGDLLKTWEVFKIFLPFLIGVTLFMFLVIYLGYKKEKPTQYHLLTTSIIMVCIFSFVIFGNETIEKKLRAVGVFYKKNSNLAVRGLRFGYLTNFFQEAIFLNKKPVPQNYQPDEIVKIAEKYQLHVPINDEKNLQKPDNVIVLMVEAFTDPLDLEWQFGQEPIPSFRTAQELFGDYTVFSPVYGGKSINAEFELMTGLTNRYTPIESLPYQEYVDKKMPGLVDSFSANGYTTNTVQVVRFKGFGYGKIYDYLGVDHKISLAGDNYQLDPSGKYTGSDDIAKKILQVTDQQDKSFIFAFPNSTHSPWYLEDYPETKILLENDTANQYVNNEISAYANALNHADQLLGLLMAGYEHSDEKTLIVMMGDHQPGLSLYNDNYQFDPRQSEYANSIIQSYRVPMAIWSNYPLKEIKEKELSMNLLPSYILELADIPINGIMKFNAIMRRQFSVFSQLIKSKNDDIYHQDEPAGFKSLADDYQMLQYDLLFGEQYLKDVIK